MNIHLSVLGLGLAFLGDLGVVWLSWRYFIRPRLDKFVRRIADEQIAQARRTQPTEGPKLHLVQIRPDRDASGFWGS